MAIQQHNVFGVSVERVRYVTSRRQNKFVHAQILLMFDKHNVAPFVEFAYCLTRLEFGVIYHFGRYQRGAFGHAGRWDNSKIIRRKVENVRSGTYLNVIIFVLFITVI